jgi:hypothetical protein
LKDKMATRELTITLDELDYKAVVRCIAQKEQEGPAGVPEGDSDLNGAALAEICRGWEEMLSVANE